MKVALIGYGAVARSLLRLLVAKKSEHTFEIAGIHRQKGTIWGEFDPLNPVFGACATSVSEYLVRCHADVLVELSTLNPHTGEPASSHIREALERGMHVVTANKGPVAHAYHELADTAKRKRVRFLHESSVMDGAPLFNQVRNNLPGVRVLGFTGVLNSTSKLVIEAMEQGGSFEDGVNHARRLGVAEENVEYDIEGWDSASKTAALANVFLDARTTPAQVEREGIQKFTAEQVRGFAAEGKTVRLISRAHLKDRRLQLRVAPEILPKTDLLAAVTGTSNLILLHTDHLGTIGTVSISPGVEQTAYGVYIDLLELLRYPAF